MLFKEMKDLNTQKTSCIHDLEDNIVQMAILLKLIYRFDTNSIRIPAAFLVEIDKPILKLIWNCKGPRIAKTILKKEKVDSHFPVQNLLQGNINQAGVELIQQQTQRLME